VGAGHFIDDAVDVFDEAHLEHFVAFVEDEIMDFRYIEGAPLDEVIKTARGADDDLGFSP